MERTCPNDGRVMNYLPLSMSKDAGVFDCPYCHLVYGTHSAKTLDEAADDRLESLKIVLDSLERIVSQDEQLMAKRGNIAEIIQTIEKYRAANEDTKVDGPVLSLA